MGRSALDLGGDAVRVAVRPLPLLTSRRHIDLLRVSSAASSLRDGGPASAHA
ncbi:putative leader peptide [Streptomyces sp. NPDC052015]|uniref:putative leader peptide n=1 Tax=Streptomyces sp. NPDC052015 TaxID=3154755 RepID=UPI003449EAF9